MKVHTGHRQYLRVYKIEPGTVIIICQYQAYNQPPSQGETNQDETNYRRSKIKAGQIPAMVAG